MRLKNSKFLGFGLLFCLFISLTATVSAATPVWSGGPYTFNGSNPVTTSSAIGISGNNPWSIAAWVYSFTGGPNNGYGWGIVGWGNAATNQGNFLYYNDAERTFEYGFYSNDGQTAANYNPNTWYHVADTWDGTTQRIYVNGALVASRTPGSRSLANTTAKIGTDPFNQGRNFKGGMERVQIYNVALTASEVSALAATAPTWIPSGSATPTPTRSVATPTPTTRPGTPTPTSPPLTGDLIRVEPLPGTKINSTFWNARIKNIITTWIPYCYNQLSNTSLAEGGIDNFVQAGRKLQGLSYKAHVGYWFSNAYVHNTVEAMCYACMIDPQGDSAIISAQNAMKSKLEDWIPKILSAQEPDGYLHTWTTLGNNPRWTDRAAHEGYTGGYFLEAAIAHYLMTNRTDARLYNAAKKLADCWCANKPGLGQWWDGHEEMEQAMTRFGVFVNGVEGGGKGDKYINCAKKLMDVRYSSSSGQYDQSHAYPINQTTAVGHAVRAAYLYSGMAEVANLLGNSSYANAVNAIWSNMIDRKMYITGGLGSGETSEGFGADYSLPNATAYCESCAGCGNIFFNNNMFQWTKNGKYVDIMELALYNNVLGSLTLNANLYTYTNSLDTTSARYSWHSCPCCVGNIPRTILSLMKWTYAKTSNAIYVNMYVGSTFTVTGVAGTNVQMVQATNYPWENTVTITVNPSTAANFTIYLHSPDRSVSACYSSTPSANGISSITVNGSSVSTASSNGYVAINRTWAAGDKIVLTIPLTPQRVKAVSNVAACSGRVAIQYGPLIYNAEAVDHNNADVRNLILSPSAALTANWNSSLLGGVITINGTFTNGQAMTLIPNYARLNRGGRSIVWLRDQ
ncbi:MAG: glycoside hydrolase family 127 protein [Firmicutes bacterium]|nr:glycoside hydrolase family 127 protein [Bacillota bacterium]